MANAASGWLSTALVSAILAFCLIKLRKIFALLSDWIIYLTSIRPYFKHQYIQDQAKPKDIQVIICGFPRTGTMSMMIAMEILGFPCFHGSHLTKPTNMILFEKAVKYGTIEHWKALLDGYGAIADWPATYAYKKLMEVYPNAKIILTVRNPDDWYTSFSKTLLHLHSSLTYYIIPQPAMEFPKRYFDNKILKGRANDRDSSIESYYQHISAVKASVDPKRLLIYELGRDGGWNSLCEFLNVPKPNVPFPSSNDREKIQSLASKAFTIHIIVVISYLTLASLTIKLFWA